MATELPQDNVSIGLDDASWVGLSKDQAQSLLRLCAVSGNEDRTYSNVAILATPNGASLYMKTAQLG